MRSLSRIVLILDKFAAAQKPATFLLTIAAALMASIVTVGLGMAWRNWMRRVRR
jgi:hypothetical protein